MGSTPHVTKRGRIVHYIEFSCEAQVEVSESPYCNVKKVSPVPQQRQRGLVLAEMCPAHWVNG